MSGLVLDPRWQSALGLFGFCVIAWVFSERRLHLPPLRRFLAVFGFQIAVAALFLRVPAARASLENLNGIVIALREATEEATSFLFGYLGRDNDLPFYGAAEGGGPFFVFAFQALPLIVVVAALAAVLWHWGVLKLVIRGFALFLTNVLGTGGAVAFASAANVLLGVTESPLLIRPLLRSLTRSELFAIITCGFATVAGTVMTLYAVILTPIGTSMLGHVIVASILSVPASLLFAELMIPPAPGERPTVIADAGSGPVYRSTMDAFTTGAAEGGRLWAGVIVAMLAFLALAALVNIVLGAAPDVMGSPLTLERLLGWLFAPLVWLAGVPWNEAQDAGQLMGIKTALNEVIAYLAFVSLPADALSPRSELIMVYALCGFANVGSLGIAIGGLSAIEPERRDDILELTPKALVSGTLATLSSGAVIGLLY